MKLISLSLTKFKRFIDKQIEFNPGLNIIWGQNESGKSTIYDAIVRSFFGKDRGKAVENWSGGPSSSSLVYTADDETFILERLFTEGISRLSQIVDDQLIDTVTTKDAISTRITKHLGITSKAVLDNTVFIKQADMSRPGSSDMSVVGDEIQRILTGTAQTNATDAIRKLESARDDVKGKPRPANPREYDRINQRITSLAEEIAKARASRERITRISNELSELDVRIEHETERLDSLKLFIDQYNRWSELKKHESELNEKHKELFQKLRDIDESQSKFDSIQLSLQKYAPLIGKDDEILAQLTVITNKINELELKSAKIEGSSETYHSSTGGLVFILMATVGILLSIASIYMGIAWNKAYFYMLFPVILLLLLYKKMQRVNQSAIKNHLMNTNEAVKNDLNQVRTEEKSILNYLGTKNSKESIEKIQMYRQLVAKSNDQDIIHKTLLSGKNINELRKNEIELDRELNSIRREIEADYLNYHPTQEEAAKWKSEYSALQNSLPNAIKRKHELTGALEAENNNIKDIAALNGEMAYLQSRRKELDFLHSAYEESISALNKITREVSDEYLPMLSHSATEYMNKLTNGRYTSVEIKGGWDIKVDSNERNSVSPDILSMGTLDQLYFSLRLACGEILAKGVNLPIILDDPFASFDQNRLMEALNMLTVIAETNQTILLTHDPQVREWAEQNKEQCSIILL